MATLAAVVLLAACSAAPQAEHGSAERPLADRAVGGPAAPPPAVAAPPESASARPATSDSTAIARLEREARALAHTSGCTAPQCRTAPLGSRPCGGPREYLVYCAATTDSAALFAKLAELERAERAFDQARGLASTCEFRSPPNVAVSAGRCVATPSNQVPVQ